MSKKTHDADTPIVNKLVAELNNRPFAKFCLKKGISPICPGYRDLKIIWNHQQRRIDKLEKELQEAKANIVNRGRCE